MHTGKEKDFWAQKGTYLFKKDKKEGLNKKKVTQTQAEFHPLGFIQLRKNNPFRDDFIFMDWANLEEKRRALRLRDLLSLRNRRKRTFSEKRLDRKKNKLLLFYSRVKSRLRFRLRIQEIFRKRRRRKNFLKIPLKKFKHRRTYGKRRKYGKYNKHKRKGRFFFRNRRKKLVFRGTKKKINDGKKTIKFRRKYGYYKISESSKTIRFRRAYRKKRRGLCKLRSELRIKDFFKIVQLQYERRMEEALPYKRMQDERARNRQRRKDRWKNIRDRNKPKEVKKIKEVKKRMIIPVGPLTKKQTLKRLKRQRLLKFKKEYFDKISCFRFEWPIQKTIRRWVAHLRWRRRRSLNPRNINKFRRKFGLIINKSNKVKRLLIRYFNFRNKNNRFFKKRGFFFGLKRTAKRKYLMDRLNRRYKKKFRYFHKRLIRLYYENISPKAFWGISRTLRRRTGGLKYERSFLRFECRLSKILYRLGVSESVSNSRDLVMKGRVGLNGRVIKDHNYVIKPGDIFGIVPKYRSVFRRLYLSKVNRNRSNKVSIRPVQFIESNYLLMLFGYIYYKFTEKYLVLPFNGRKSLMFGLGKRNL